MATSYKLFGEGKYIDSTGVVHNRIPLNEVLDNLNITVFYKKYDNIYTTSSEIESIIPIGIDAFNESTILFVYVNGLEQVENVDYTIDYNNKTIILANGLDIVGTEVHFVVLKTIATTTENYDLLKGEKGEGIKTGGTAGQVLIKKSDEDYDVEWGETSAITINRWEAEA